ncbi:hypothetical protein E2542_SST06093 [Spatholobus suberectus]|nr:hypothetical protein E2542_SST06093 [Spatholobus suberectus]
MNGNSSRRERAPWVEVAGEGGGLGRVVAEDEIFDVVPVTVCHSPATYIAKREKTIREKFNSFLDRRRRKDSGDKVVVNMELGVKKVDRLVENQGTKEQFVIICEGSHRFQIATCGDIDIIITRPHRRRYCLISYNIYSLLKKIFIYTEVFLNSN